MSDSTNRPHWPLVLAVAIPGMLLGFWGHMLIPDSTVPDSVYQTIQLFFFDSPTTHPTPLQLHAARFLCGAASFVTIFGFFANRIRQAFAATWVRSRGGHEVVVGLSRFGLSIVEDAVASESESDPSLGVGGFRARQEQTARRPVIVVDPAPPQDAARRVRQLGVPLISGAESTEALLERAGIDRAKLVLAVHEDDSVNIQAAILSRGPCRALVREGDLRSGLSASGVYAESVEFNDLDFDELRARHFLRHVPIEAGLDGNPEPLGTDTHSPPRTLRLVLVGWSSFSKELLLQVARVGHYHGYGPLQVALADPDAKAAITSLRARSPAIDEIFQLHPWEHQPKDHAMRGLAVRWIDDSIRSGEPLTFAVVGDDPVSDRVDHAAWLQQLIPDSTGTVRIQVDLEGSKSWADVLACEAFASQHPNVQWLEPKQLQAMVREWKYGMSDALAKNLHEEYNRGRRVARIEGNDLEVRPAERPWGELSESYRRSSRALADHLPIKLRAIGCRIAPLEEGVGERVTVIPRRELSILSELEHLRWSSERRLAGWVHGKERDDRNQVHPLLLPWSDLEEHDRYLDETLIQHASHALQKLGLGIFRVSEDEQATPRSG